MTGDPVKPFVKKTVNCHRIIRKENSKLSSNYLALACAANYKLSPILSPVWPCPDRCRCIIVIRLAAHAAKRVSGSDKSMFPRALGDLIVDFGGSGVPGAH
jgi:hypothetical protein